jgi:ABC-2 type transport system permease protein
MRSTVAASVGLVAVMTAVGAMFPAVGHSIGALNVPQGVANLLGGADYGTVTGWFRSEIGAIYGPLLSGGLAIAGAGATLAGEEESGVLAVILSCPLGRRSLVVSKAAAIAVVVAVVSLAAWVGLMVGVTAAGGGIPVTHMAALAVQLAFFGFAVGAVALAFAAGSGNRGLAVGVATAIALAGWLVDSFAPLISALSWLRYLSFYYYYAGHDPLGQGIWVTGVAVLACVSVSATAVGAYCFSRRDLRG